MLTLNASGMKIEDTTGRRIFDSNERMFHVTDTITGTRSIAAKSSGINASHSTNTTYVLGSCHAAATHLIGAFRITFPGASNPSGVPGFGWFNAGGSYIHWFDGSTCVSPSGYANNPALKIDLTVWAQYTPRVAGGQFLLDEWVHVFGFTSGGIASSYILNAFNLQYHFKAGLFTI
jgi:hypothetical protein